MAALSCFCTSSIRLKTTSQQVFVSKMLPWMEHQETSFSDSGINGLQTSQAEHTESILCAALEMYVFTISP